jgi:predicted acyltransferase
MILFTLSHSSEQWNVSQVHIAPMQTAPLPLAPCLPCLVLAAGPADNWSGSPLQIHGHQALALLKILISHNFVMGHGWSGPSFIVLQETQHATTADSLVRHALNIVKYKQKCITKTDPCVGFPPHTV